MIPLRDNLHLRGVPLATVALIVLNAAVFFYQYFTLPVSAWSAFVQAFGLVPDSFAGLWRQDAAVAAYQPLVTSLFLHGGIMHLVGNMWYLWLFGHSSELCLGRWRYLLVYFACGVAANLVHVAVYPESAIPIIGASGAVSGILGAYLYCFPRAKILMLVPLFLFFTILEVPATAFVGVWFLLQLVNGLTGLMALTMIAWWAHIGGFLAGMALVRLLPKR